MDVIAEDRKSGIRKTMTLYAARLLSHRFRVVEEVRGPISKPLVKSPTFKPELKPLTELERLRKEYEQIFGKSPHHLLKEAKLKTLIESELNK